MEEQQYMNETESDTSSSEDNYWMTDPAYESAENESGELTTDGEHEPDDNGHKRLSKSEIIQIEEQIIAEIHGGDFDKEVKKLRLEKAVQKIRKGICVEKQHNAANAIDDLSIETISMKSDCKTDMPGKSLEKTNETGLNAATNGENNDHEDDLVDGNTSMEHP